MYKIKNSNIPFVTLSKENMFTICNSLEYDEIGIIFKAFMDFVYFGIEPTFEKKYMQGIFDGVLQTMERKAEGCFASRENGKKGGRPKKSNTELQPNTDFEKEAEISPNKPDFYSDDTEVPQEAENVSEGLIQGEFDNIEDEVYNEELNDDMGKFIGYVAGFEPAVETRGAAPQISMEELQKQSIEREKRREEFANNWKTHNVQIVETEPEERELTFEMIDRCVDRFDKNIALKQVKPYLSTEENIKRLRGRLNSVLQGFSQDERDWYYGLLIENKNQ